MTTKENKIVFAVSPGKEPLLVIGIPKGSWEYMRDGKTSHFDLASVGLPLKVIIFGGETHSEVFGQIDAFIRSKSQAYANMVNHDFSIPELKKEPPDGTEN